VPPLAQDASDLVRANVNDVDACADRRRGDLEAVGRPCRPTKTASADEPLAIGVGVHYDKTAVIPARNTAVSDLRTVGRRTRTVATVCALIIAVEASKA
jgi:hypothetical protein